MYKLETIPIWENTWMGVGDGI